MTPDRIRPTGTRHRKLTIDQAGARWAYALGRIARLDNDPFPPFREQSPHIHYWWLGRRADDFAFRRSPN